MSKKQIEIGLKHKPIIDVHRKISFNVDNPEKSNVIFKKLMLNV